MAIVTLPNTTAIYGNRQPRFIRVGEVMPAGTLFYVTSTGRAKIATNSNLSLSDVKGVTTADANAVDQWVSYAEPGDYLVVSGLTKGKAYFLGHGTDEVQTVTITGTPSGGNFRLTFAGQQTANIAFDAAAATVQAALEALSSIDSGNVTVTGSAGGPYAVTFKFELGGQNVAIMTASHTFTGGTAPNVDVAETTPGAAGGNLCEFSDLVSGYSVVGIGWAQDTTSLAFAPAFLNTNL